MGSPSSSDSGSGRVISVGAPRSRVLVQNHRQRFVLGVEKGLPAEQVVSAKESVDSTAVKHWRRQLTEPLRLRLFVAVHYNFEVNRCSVLRF